jgi:predicted nucleotidyltransferase component of viral defense system
MIDKREILEHASALKLSPHVVEKDYVLGWILGGIYANAALVDSWVFKGGTCLKKCYFETYRFSEDLDFTLLDANHLDETFLKRAFNEVIGWVAEQSGISMPEDQLSFDVYVNKRGKISCQGKIGYRGPVSPTSNSWPKIKLDLTADEKLVLPAARREVFHPYSDRPEDKLWINCYKYVEAFAEKFRALSERTRPRDLYDVVNLYRHGDDRPSPVVLRDVLQQKCTYKSIALPTLEALTPHRTDLEAKWQQMLGHQLPVLPSAVDFWDALPEIFSWMMSTAQAPERTPIKSGFGEVVIRSRVLPMNIPVRTRATLEIIRFAAANYLCVDLTYVDLKYTRKVRRIEPYSLRKTQEGNYVLHAVRSDSGEHRSYRLDRMQDASVSAQSFVPRYLVELTSTGPVRVAESAERQRSTGPRRPNRSMGSGAVNVFYCGVCGKKFQRKSMDYTLNPHKDPSGYPCYGRRGVFDHTKHS